MVKGKKNNQKYQYCGDGAGIPGLPHELDSDQAEKLGLTKTLNAAVRSGAYQEISSEPEMEAGEEPVEEEEINNG